MTDKPDSPDLPHVDPEQGPDIEVRFPPDARVPSSTVPTRPPSPSEYEDEELHEDAMQYAPRWGRHINERINGAVDRLSAVEAALHLLAKAFDVEAGIPALRHGLAKEIAEIMAGYVDRLLQDNANIKRELADVQSRLKIVEGDIESLKRAMGAGVPA